MRNWVRFSIVAVMICSFFISGCGGGGGGAAAPAGPAAPTGVSATAASGQVTIGWTTVAGATSYNIYYSTTTGVSKTSPGVKLTGVTSPNAVTGLTNGTPYFFVVTAVNGGGESAESSQVSGTPNLNPPAAPTGVSATAGSGQATISWSPVTGATSYNIYYSTTTGVTKLTGTKVSGVTSPNPVTGLTNGTPYFFVVTAVNADGEGVESSQVTATPAPNPPPAAPTGVLATAGAGQATISWTAVTGAASYNIYYSTTTGVTKASGTKVTGATSPATVPNLIRGITYFFVVTAVNADGESVESSQVSAIPEAPSPSFAQSDLAGTWKVHVILSGVNPGWYHFTALVQANGSVTISNPSSSSGVSIPSVPAWSVSAGSGVSAGVVTETGGNATFHGKLSSSKNLIVGTSTFSAGTFALHVFQRRVPGVTYGSADLAGTTFAYNRIFTGNSHIWEIASGSINGSGQVTISSLEDSLGPATPPPANYTTISVDATGIVTIAAEPTFSGVMSADKKVIVGISTDAVSPARYSLRIIQLRGQTYSAADLAGAYLTHSFHSDSVSSWAWGTWTISAASATAANVTATDIANSDGSFDPGPASWTYNVDAQGRVTDPVSLTSHGIITFGKDMVVHTADYLDGSTMNITVQ